MTAFLYLLWRHVFNVPNTPGTLENAPSPLFHTRTLPAAGLGLFTPPAGHGFMVAADQHLRHRHAAKHPRSGILRIFNPAGVAVAFLGDTLRVAQNTRHIADHGIDQHHGRHFAAVADKIADRDLP